MIGGGAESGEGVAVVKSRSAGGRAVEFHLDSRLLIPPSTLCPPPPPSPRASEGKTVEVPYKGPVEATVRDVLGGVRSSCTYVGAGKLKELSRRTTFIRVTQQLNTVFGNDS